MPTLDDETEPLALDLIKWTPRAGAAPLLGTCDVLVENAFAIHSIGVVKMGSQLVLSLPARPVINASGNLVRDTSYAVVWEPVLSWRHADEYAQFSETVIALLRARYPRAIPRNCRLAPRRDIACQTHPEAMRQ